MLKALLARAAQGHRTMAYPGRRAAAPARPLPGRARGSTPSKCPDGCRECADACPTEAIVADGALALDLGRCLFCTECVAACPEGAITFTDDYRLATRSARGSRRSRSRTCASRTALDEKLRRLFGRSLKLRVR